MSDAKSKQEVLELLGLSFLNDLQLQTINSISLLGEYYGKCKEVERNYSQSGDIPIVVNWKKKLLERVLAICKEKIESEETLEGILLPLREKFPDYQFLEKFILDGYNFKDTTEELKNLFLSKIKTILSEIKSFFEVYSLRDKFWGMGFATFEGIWELRIKDLLPEIAKEVEKLEDIPEILWVIPDNKFPTNLEKKIRKLLLRKPEEIDFFLLEKLAKGMPENMREKLFFRVVRSKMLELLKGKTIREINRFMDEKERTMPVNSYSNGHLYKTALNDMIWDVVDEMQELLLAKRNFDFLIECWHEPYRNLGNYVSKWVVKKRFREIFYSELRKKEIDIYDFENFFDKVRSLIYKAWENDERKKKSALRYMDKKLMNFLDKNQKSLNQSINELVRLLYHQKKDELFNKSKALYRILRAIISEINDIVFLSRMKGNIWGYSMTEEVEKMAQNQTSKVLENIKEEYQGWELWKKYLQIRVRVSKSFGVDFNQLAENALENALKVQNNIEELFDLIVFAMHEVNLRVENCRTIRRKIGDKIEHKIVENLENPNWTTDELMSIRKNIHLKYKENDSIYELGWIRGHIIEAINGKIAEQIKKIDA